MSPRAPLVSYVPALEQKGKMRVSEEIRKIDQFLSHNGAPEAPSMPIDRGLFLVPEDRNTGPLTYAKKFDTRNESLFPISSFVPSFQL